PYFRAMLDLETAAPGQVYLFDTGYCKLATYDAIRAHGSDLVTILHESITVESVEERVVATPVTARGYLIHSDRLVHLGTGKTRSRYLWRLLNQTTGDWHRGALADTSRVVTPLNPSARTSCAKNDDSGYSPSGASPHTSRGAPCSVWLSAGSTHFATLC